MQGLLKSEFRKLFTIRSTYVLLILLGALLVLFSFYFEGYKGNTGSAASEVGATAFQEIASNSTGLGVLFIAIIAILFMAHEYRYNMIVYTLTSTVRRSKVLAAKLITITIVAAVVGVAVILLSLGLYLLGLTFRDATLPAQDFNLMTETSRAAVYYAAYALIGMLFAVLFRSVVGAVGLLFGMSVVVEPLLSMVLKDNAIYLPIAATDSIVRATMLPGTLSPGKAMLVSGAYLLVGWIVAWILFLRRDAN